MARGHFLAKHSGVAVAEEEYEAACGYRRGADFGGLFDGGNFLLSHLVQKVCSFFEVGYGGIHEDLRIADVGRAWPISCEGERLTPLIAASIGSFRNIFQQVRLLMRVVP